MGFDKPAMWLPVRWEEQTVKEVRTTASIQQTCHGKWRSDVASHENKDSTSLFLREIQEC